MDDPVTIRQDVVAGTMDGGDMVVLTKYEKPAEVFGEDHWRDYDIWAANRMMSLLLTVYPGYPWHTRHDTIQGYAKVSIPILMGVCSGIVINLKTHQLSAGLVIAAGGEVLERYKLSRTRFSLSAFLEARQQHSKLVVPSRSVPG